MKKNLLNLISFLCVLVTVFVFEVSARDVRLDLYLLTRTGILTALLWTFLAIYIRFYRDAYVKVVDLSALPDGCVYKATKGEFRNVTRGGLVLNLRRCKRDRNGGWDETRFGNEFNPHKFPEALARGM